MTHNHKRPTGFHDETIRKARQEYKQTLGGYFKKKQRNKSAKNP